MRRTRRGSVAVFAMIMVVSTAAVAIAMLAFTGGQRTKQTRLEADRIVQNAFDGGVDVVRDMAARGVLRLPQTVNLSIGGVSESLAISSSANTSVGLNGISVTPPSSTILVSGTLTYQSNTYRQQQIIGRGLLSTVWQYALYDGANLSSAYTLTTGSPGLGGDVWVDGSISLPNAGCHIGGDLTATNTISPSTLNVDGVKTSASPAITFPDVDKTGYRNAAQQVTSSTSVSSYVFPGVFAGSGYPILYSNSTLSIGGTISGSGVFFVAGDVTITSDLVVTPGCHVVIITPSKVIVRSTVGSIGAYIYCGNEFSTSASLRSTAGIVARSVSLGGNLDASFDSYVRDNPVGAYNLRLPGVWSGTATVISGATLD